MNSIIHDFFNCQITSIAILQLPAFSLALLGLLRATSCSDVLKTVPIVCTPFFLLGFLDFFLSFLFQQCTKKGLEKAGLLWFLGSTEEQRALGLDTSRVSPDTQFSFSFRSFSPLSCPVTHSPASSPAWLHSLEESQRLSARLHRVKSVPTDQRLCSVDHFQEGDGNRTRRRTRAGRERKGEGLRPRETSASSSFPSPLPPAPLQRSLQRWHDGLGGQCPRLALSLVHLWLAPPSSSPVLLPSPSC